MGFDSIHKFLDRAIANPIWINFFPKSILSNLPLYTSDHTPFLLCLFGAQEPFIQRPFTFLAAYLRDKDFERLI